MNVCSLMRDGFGIAISETAGFFAAGFDILGNGPFLGGLAMFYNFSATITACVNISLGPK